LGQRSFTPNFRNDNESKKKKPNRSNQV
jgi:hypothetical protein